MTQQQHQQQVAAPQQETRSRSLDPAPMLKPPAKLWLPEPTYEPPASSEPQMQGSALQASPQQVPPPRPSPQQASTQPVSIQMSSPQPGPLLFQQRSRSRPRKPSPEVRRKRRRGSGWDMEDQKDNAAVPAPVGRPITPVGSSAPAHIPVGAKEKAQLWAPTNRNGIPEATPEALQAAVLRAAQVEAAGQDAIRQTGQIPRGPPDLPTGTEVIEQRCIPYLIGRGGAALAAVKSAAGVQIEFDQTSKMYGLCMAMIYGSQEGTQKAKMILRQKIAEYRPKK